MDHAKYPPSSAAIWSRCPGSVGLKERLGPQIYPTNEDATRDGRIAHEFASAMLKLGPSSMSRELSYFIGKAPTALTETDKITPSMVPAVSAYLSEIATVCNAGGTSARWGMLHVEERVDIFSVNPDNWGTPDAWLYDAPLRKLFVWDFKYGGFPVDAVGNLQTADYTIGLIKKLGVPEDGKIEVVIVQPNAYHGDSIKRWEFLAKDIGPFYDLLHAATRSDEIRTGGHCRFCEVRTHCPALREVVSNIDGLLAQTPAIGIAPGPDNIGVELSIAKDLQRDLHSFVTGLEGQVEGAIKKGWPVQGCHLEEKESALKFRESADLNEVACLGDFEDIELRKPVALVTPTQAIKAGMDKDLINGYAHRTIGKALAPITKQDVADAFGDKK